MRSADFDACVVDLLRAQCDVVAGHQLRERGIGRHRLQRWLRGSHLVSAVPGVYVAQTGPLTDRQRAWVAVLAAWPAALGGRTALQLGLRREPTGTIEVVIGPGRTLVPRPGVRVTRRSHLDRHVAWNLSPPRLRIEEATLDVAVAQGEAYAAVETLAEACREGATTADRLLTALDARSRVAHRAFLREVLHDVRDGAMSVLERGYLQLERAHGLPRPTRQRREELGGVRAVRDAEYEAFGVIVELDGQVFHDGRRRQDDMARDALVTLDDRVTLRLGWHQAFDGGCTTAAQVAHLLAARGWRGRPRPCSAVCAVARAA